MVGCPGGIPTLDGAIVTKYNEKKQLFRDEDKR